VTFIISEATALVVSTCFWLLMHANPSLPGSAAISTSQTLLNAVIMLIGEVVVTDGIIAFLSNKLKSRFRVDLAAAWAHMKAEKKVLLLAITATVGFTSLTALAPVGTTLCFTSRAETEADWVMTGCPESGRRDIAIFARVGEKWQELWLEFQ